MGRKDGLWMMHSGNPELCSCLWQGPGEPRGDQVLPTWPSPQQCRSGLSHTFALGSAFIKSPFPFMVLLWDLAGSRRCSWMRSRTWWDFLMVGLEHPAASLVSERVLIVCLKECGEIPPKRMIPAELWGPQVIQDPQLDPGLSQLPPTLRENPAQLFSVALCTNHWKNLREKN